ncbi:hypothetical protein ACFLZV_03815 [Candidatus Margulisiibacteriota bacterium]
MKKRIIKALAFFIVFTSISMPAVNTCPVVNSLLTNTSCHKTSISVCTHHSSSSKNHCACQNKHDSRAIGQCCTLKSEKTDQKYTGNHNKIPEQAPITPVVSKINEPTPPVIDLQRIKNVNDYFLETVRILC